MASSSTVSLDDLCEDLLLKIFACAASSSIQTCHSIRRVSKKFHSLSYHPSVLIGASLDVSMHQWNQYAWSSSPPWTLVPDDFLAHVEKYDEFVNLCDVAGNPQAPMAIFELGLRQYFEAGMAERYQQDRGLRNLAYAATKGIRDAAEFYGVILLCLGGEHRQTAFNVLRPLRISLTKWEVLEAEARWTSHVRRLWWDLRPGFIVYHLTGTYNKENCQCDGATSQWFSTWLGLDHLEEMPPVEACEPCLWHACIQRIF